MTERSRGRRGRDDRTRSTRPGERRRAAGTARSGTDSGELRLPPTSSRLPPLDSPGVDEIEVEDAGDGHPHEAESDDEAPATDGLDDAQADAKSDDDDSRGAGDREPGERRLTREERLAAARSIRQSRLRASAASRLRQVNPRHAVILAVVLSFVTLTLAMPMRTYFSQRSEFAQLRASNEQLTKEVAEYQQKVNEQGDPAYTEAKARARLQYARPGETVLVLTFPGREQRQADAERAAARARNPWYGNLWDSVATPVQK